MKIQAYSSCTGFYIGLFESTYVSNWTWVNYDPKSYRNWKSGIFRASLLFKENLGYPSQDATAGCTVLNANDGTWTNQACSTPQCYICSY